MENFPGYEMSDSREARPEMNAVKNPTAGQRSSVAVQCAHPDSCEFVSAFGLADEVDSGRGG
jgi:hypothetical protein